MKKAIQNILNKELTRFFLSVFTLFLTAILMGFCQQISDIRWRESAINQIPLSDVFHDLFPFIPTTAPGDAMMLSILAITLLVLTYQAPGWISRLILWRRLFWLCSGLYLFRCITISFTTMPSAKPCVPESGGPFDQMFRTAFEMIVGSKKACTDSIYSGHTMITVSSMLHWRIYSRTWWARWLFYIYGIATIYIILTSRFHYTVDICLAIFITYSFYSIYHAAIYIYTLKHLKGINSKNLENDELYQAIAYTPHILNYKTVKVVAWLDGLDIRVKQLQNSGHSANGYVVDESDFSYLQQENHSNNAPNKEVSVHSFASNEENSSNQPRSFPPINEVVVVPSSTTERQ